MDREQRRVAYAVLRWIRIARHENPEIFKTPTHRHDVPTYADADHSSLLARLVAGEEPFAQPPPLSHAYPDTREAEELGMKRDPSLERY